MTVQVGIRKVTISLPSNLLEYADHAAKETNVSRSQIIGDALAEVKARADETLAAEGYQFYAVEAEEFAAASASAFAEVIDDER